MSKTIKQIIFAAVFVFAAAVPLTVYAYLQKTEEKKNEFTIGEDKEQVTEVFTEPSYISMQGTFEKKVYVENTGTSDQFVRVYLDFSDSRVRDNAMIVYQKENQTQTKSWDEFLRNLPENWTYVSYVSTDDTDYSTLGGYFYYTKVLKPDETTTALIDSITTDFRTDDTDTNTDNIKDFDIIVYSESVQTVEIDTSGTVYTDTDWKKAWKSFLHISENGS